jgi:formiminotetrahydrofolate cyclodeaminase
LARAYGLPRDTPEALAERERVMEGALAAASEAPLEIMRNCAAAIDIIEAFAQKGSRLAISDAGTGAVFCKAALLGASLNVFVNTKLMKDRALAESLNAEARLIIARYEKKADAVFQGVMDRLGS